MDRDRLSAIAHRSHPIAAPVSDASFDNIIAGAASRAPASVLDIGCGAGWWLVSLLARVPQARGLGVDRSSTGLAAARTMAVRAGLADRVELLCADATEWAGEAAAGSWDAALCVGSTHALGGLAHAVAELGRLVRPGGLVVVGEGYWQRPPTAEALAALDAREDEFSSYGGLVDVITQAGFTPLHGHRSTPREWDEYEWAWTSNLALWATDNPNEADAAEAADWADTHRRQWLHGYLDVLGFAVITAVRPDPSAS